jgi:hypothetical protein
VQTQNQNSSEEIDPTPWKQAVGQHRMEKDAEDEEEDEEAVSPFHVFVQPPKR